MASCITSKWVSTSPQIKLIVTENTSKSDGDTAVLDWELQYIASYAADTAVNKSYTVKINGETVKTGTYDIDGKTGTKTIASGSKSIAKSTSSKSVSFSCSMDINITWSGSYKGTISASSSVSVSAKTKYTVSYNANGGTGAPSSQTKWYGTTLTLSSTKPTRTGYNFKNWKSTQGSTVYYFNPGSTTTYNGNQTMYAQWTAKTWTVSYNANGGSGAPSSQTKTYGTTLTLSSTKPTRTGYIFKGWATSSSGTVAYNAGASYTSNASITLYAVWQKATYTVKYNANGGTGAPASQTKTYGTALTLRTGVPTRATVEESGTTTTYKFKGWSTSSTATTVSYAAGSSYNTNADVTLYAVWADSSITETYTISYNSDGGTEILPQVKTKTVNLTLTSDVPKKEGYDFVQWVAVDGNGTIVANYQPGDICDIDDDLILTAQWNPYIHTVQFDANGGVGDVPASFTKTAGVEAVIPQHTLTKDMCSFKCWCTNPNGSGGVKYYTGDGYVNTQNGGTVTLYAIWNSRIISFKNDGTMYISELIERYSNEIIEN